MDKGKLPADVADNLEGLYYNYKNAVNTPEFQIVIFYLVQLKIIHGSRRVNVSAHQVLQNGDPNAYEIMLSNMMALFDRVLLDVEVLPSIPITFPICLTSFYVPRCPFTSSFILLQNPFTFPPYHKAIREPFDYYMFGQNYIRPLVDFR